MKAARQDPDKGFHTVCGYCGESTHVDRWDWGWSASRRLDIDTDKRKVAIADCPECGETNLNDKRLEEKE